MLKDLGLDPTNEQMTATETRIPIDLSTGLTNLLRNVKSSQNHVVMQEYIDLLANAVDIYLKHFGNNIDGYNILCSYQERIRCDAQNMSIIESDDIKTRDIKNGNLNSYCEGVMSNIHDPSVQKMLCSVFGCEHAIQTN